MIGVSSYAYEIQNKQENTPSGTYGSSWNGEDTGREEEEWKCEVLKDIWLQSSLKKVENNVGVMNAVPTKWVSIHFF